MIKDQDNKKNILIVDDEADIRNLVQGILEDESYGTVLAGSSAQAYDILAQKTVDEAVDLVILDIWLQGSEHDGLQILEKIQKSHSYIPVIMISGHGTIETAVSTIKQGAYDFIEKPFKSDRLLLMVQRALETAALKRENVALKQQADTPLDLIGGSAFIKNLRDVIKRAAPSNSRVLLSGEAGTGKDVVARLLHRGSKRADKPFLSLNCAVLRPETLEIELFGVERADNEGEVQVGILEKAHGGTLFLDEIADMPLETQGKIIRVLQDQNFQRVGGSRSINADVRIIASSNRDLQQAIEKGDFREDLFYRLNVVPIHMVSLRERAEDVDVLSQHFLDILCRNAGLTQKRFSAAAMEVLSGHSWPGNIRQLHNVLEWVMIMHGGLVESEFGVEHLPPELGGGEVKSGGASVHHLSSMGGLDHAALDLPLREAREVFERGYLFAQVDRFGGNVSKTAKFIGMERSALHRKLKSLQLSDDQDGAPSGDDQGVTAAKQQRA